MVPPVAQIRLLSVLEQKFRAVSSRQPRFQNAALEEEVGRDYDP